jgi:uncharacterized delta-60 repeat protein
MLSASTLDTTYNSPTGFNLADLSGNGTGSVGVTAAIQSDDKVVVGGIDQVPGVPEVNIARFGTDGKLDPTFDASGPTPGVFQLSISPDPADQTGDVISSIKVDAQGRIVADGQLSDGNLFVLRLLGNGTLDPSFGNGAGFITDENLSASSPTFLSVRPDGTVLVAGTAGNGSGYLAQFTSTGAIDTSFASGAGVTTFNVDGEFITSGLALQSNGGAIVEGNAPSSPSQLALTRIQADGTLDTNFGDQGFALTEPQAVISPGQVAVDSGDRIYASFGFDTDTNVAFGVERFSSGGQVDGTYGSGGVATISDPNELLGALAITVDSSNRVVFSGFAGAGSAPSQVVALLGRFDATGNPDASFSSTGYVTLSMNSNDQSEIAETPLVQSDGLIVIAGAADTDTFVARFGDAQVTPPPPPPSTPVTVDVNGNLLIPGTNGNDTFQVNVATGGVDVIYNGIDAGVFHPTGQIIVNGKNGDDKITIDPAITLAASINGGAGNDTITGGGGNDSIDGGAGNNNLAGGAGDDTLTGSSGNDTIDGGSGSNLIKAGGGLDVITAGDGNNTVTGAGDNDSITVGNGNNTISGGGANDVIVAGNGNNSIAGGAGNDSITAGNGSNTISGGAGDDVIVVGGSATSVNIIDGGAGNDSITLSSGENGSLGHPSSSITGGAGDDTLIGGTGADNIDGGAGNDIIVAGAGNDTVTGGAGNDIIIGDTGADNLTGGGDDDILIGGTTSYDSNLIALNAIKAEWTSSDTYAQRVANIENGSGSGSHLNGPFFLTPNTATATVFNDSTADTLTGSGGTDLFYKSTGDTITDLAKSETTATV